MTLDLTPIPAPSPLEWPPVLDRIRALAPELGAPLYLVGGAVRDGLLHRPIHDLDFVSSADGQRVARQIANALGGDFYPLDSERGVGRAIFDQGGQRIVIDVSRFRGETLAEDLLGRDFTLNALAVALTADPSLIIDPLGGLRDIHDKRIRRCSATAISDDPVRALRAVRLSAAFKMLIEKDTRADLRANVHRLFDTSVERIRDEFIKTLEGPQPHAALRALDALGYLEQIIPEMVAMRGVTQSPPHLFDVWEHTLKVIEALDKVLAVISPKRTDETAADGFYGMIVYRLDAYRPRLQAHLAQTWPNDRSSRALLMLSALLHDCGKPTTRTVDDKGHVHFYDHEKVGAKMAEARLIALRLSTEEVDRVYTTIRQHMRPMHLNSAGSVSPRALYRFWNAAKVAGVDVCILTQADYLGIYGVTLKLADWLAFLEMVGTLLDGYFNRRETALWPHPLLTGDDLMQQLGLTPGPLIGSLLRGLGEAQATGQISTVEDALTLACGLIGTPEPSDEE